jgi:DNA-binding GntR family transcriptional regulator
MSFESLPQVRLDSRRHQVLHALREAIVTGQLRPGDRLVEADISQQMGVSRGTVREALRQLEQEGLAISYPYRATEVLGVSQEEIEEILVPIRLVLERFAFRRALPRLDEQDLHHLSRLVDAMRTAAQRGDPEGLAEADVHFHELVMTKSGQPHCEQIWRTIAPRVRAYFLRDAPAHSSPDEVVEEHEELLAAMKTHDVTQVLDLLEKHIRNFLHFKNDVQSVGRNE